MKKVLSLLAAALMIMLSTTAVFATPEIECRMVQVGNKRWLNVYTEECFNVAPYEDKTNDRLMIESRPFIEALGGSVSWDKKTQTQTINYYGRVFKYQANCPLCCGGVPRLVNGCMMVPIRDLAQNLGMFVYWYESAEVCALEQY